MTTQNQLSKEEVVRQIESVYHADTDPTNKNFSVYDQLLACESIAETEEKEKRETVMHPSTTILETTERTNESVTVNESVNGTYKRSINSKLTERKLQVIKELKTCNYQTPPRTVSKLLGELFADYDSKDGHWLFVAQHWPPRAISRVIVQMTKQHRTGEQSIKNPAAYFTAQIKFRKKRKIKREGRKL
jgi:hypothetical protein